MGISEIVTDISARRAGSIDISGASAARAEDCAGKLIAELGLDGGIQMEIHRAIPEHAGLGSGTQMALAVATALNLLYGLGLPLEELAGMAGRGRRSGIGVGSFRSGGFIVDGGRGADTIVPPVIARAEVPDHWRFLLVLDQQAAGLSGNAETRAFDTLAPLDAATAGEISRLVLMGVLPALAEADCNAFGIAVSRIQEILGEYFEPVQGGGYISKAVAVAMESLRHGGSAGVGQSSWGPTGFAIYSSETDAYQALRHVRAAASGLSSLEFIVCSARNRPAEVVMDRGMGRRAQR